MEIYETKMTSTKKLFRVTEHYKSPIHLEESEKFSIEEIEILEKEFSKCVKVLINYVGKQSIQTKEYVGYIILPNHIISIAPKIPQISFINMLKYAIGLGRVIPDYFELSEEDKLL